MGDSESVKRDLPGVEDGKVHSYTALLDDGHRKKDCDKLDKAQAKVQSDDPLVAILTSGSTSTRKLAQHTIHSMVNAVTVSNGRAQKPGISFCDRPMAWTGGFLIVCSLIVTPFTAVFVPTEMSLSEKTKEASIEIIAKERCSYLQLNGMLTQRLYQESMHLKYDLSAVQIIILGGQRFSQSLVANIFKVFPSAFAIIVYGATESIKIAAGFLNKDTVNTEDFGKMAAADGVEVKIVDEDNKLVPRGQTGEVCTRSVFVFLEYMDNTQEATKQARSPTGWLHTGDMGMMDELGRLEVLGRKKEIIKRATVKIFPAEIEKVLSQHPHVTDAVVIGIPDQRLHEEICACVILSPDEVSSTEARLAELEDWCGLQWPPGADGLSLKPKYFLSMEGYPMLGTGKIDGRGLKRMAMEKLRVSDTQSDMMDVNL